MVEKFMVANFMVEKSMVEKFMVEKFMVEKSMVEMSINPTKRVRCLMLPFLVIIGLSQLLIMASILACVVFLPLEAKLLAIAVTAAEVTRFTYDVETHTVDTCFIFTKK